MIGLTTDDPSRYMTILHNFKQDGAKMSRVSMDVLGHEYVYTVRGFKPLAQDWGKTVIQELTVELSLDVAGEIREYQLFECDSVDIQILLANSLVSLGVERVGISTEGQR